MKSSTKPKKPTNKLKKPTNKLRTLKRWATTDNDATIYIERTSDAKYWNYYRGVPRELFFMLFDLLINLMIDTNTSLDWAIRKLGEGYAIAIAQEDKKRTSKGDT